MLFILIQDVHLLTNANREIHTHKYFYVFILNKYPKHKELKVILVHNVINKYLFIEIQKEHKKQVLVLYYMPLFNINI